MDEVFAPAQAGWRAVSGGLRTYRRAWLAILAVPAAIACLLAALLEPVAGAVLLVLLAGGVVAVLRWIDRNSRSWAYAERAEDLVIRHGVLVRHLVVVPYGRMQYVDVEAGPLERRFAIASVHLHTAAPSTGARIIRLPPQEAARLRDRLTELGESQAAGL